MASSPAACALDGDAAAGRRSAAWPPSSGSSAVEAAAGIVRVANQEMVGALRVVTVERGIDPRGYALLAFGGAGGMHAAAIAAELEIGTVICPTCGRRALGARPDRRRAPPRHLAHA